VSTLTGELRKCIKSEIG